MKEVKIKNIGKVVSGATPSRFIPEYWNGHIPWITPKEIGQLKTPFLTKSVEQITEAGLKSCSATILPKKSVIFSSRAPIGLVAVNEIEVCTNQGFKSIIPNEDINPLYVYYVLKANKRKLNDLGTGTTFKELSKTAFENFKIPLPDTLAEQQKIAYILSKAEALIQKRKQTLKNLDQLLKSTFLEMFGDPVQNPKGWEVKTIENLVAKKKYSIKRGPFGGALKKDVFVSSGYLIYEQYHALNNDFSLARYFINEEKFKELKAFEVKSNDIIISCSGVNLGRLAIVPKNAQKGIINQALLKITLDNKVIDNQFFAYVFSHESFKREFFGYNRGSGVPNFPPMTDFKKFKFILPPRPLQTQFAEIAAKVEALKAKQEASLKELEQLYQSLMQRAFKGELDLDKVEIEDAYDEFEHFDGGFVTIEEALPALDKIREEFESLPAIKSKDKKLREKIRKLDWDKAQLGRIPFDRDYAIYRVLYRRFEHYQSVPFLTIYDWLLTDFVDLDYDKIKDFIFRELNKESPFFEQIFIFNEYEKKYRTELKLLL